MKKIIAVLAILAVVVVCSPATEDGHGWALVYTRSVVNPDVRLAVVCYSSIPDCGVAYKDEEVTEWFPTQEMALEVLNGRTIVYGSVSSFTGISSFPQAQLYPVKPENFVGLYECKRVNLRHVKVGTQKVTVQEPKEVEQDVMEWKP
jgi:hypothetical protein